MRVRVALVARVHTEYPELGPIHWAAVEALLGSSGGTILRTMIVHEARGPLATREEALQAAREFRDYLQSTPGAFAAHALELVAL